MGRQSFSNVNTAFGDISANDPCSGIWGLGRDFASIADTFSRQCLIIFSILMTAYDGEDNLVALGIVVFPRGASPFPVFSWHELSVFSVHLYKFPWYFGGFPAPENPLLKGGLPESRVMPLNRRTVQDWVTMAPGTLERKTFQQKLHLWMTICTLEWINLWMTIFFCACFFAKSIYYAFANELTYYTDWIYLDKNSMRRRYQHLIGLIQIRRGITLGHAILDVFRCLGQQKSNKSYSWNILKSKNILYIYHLYYSNIF